MKLDQLEAHVLFINSCRYAYGRNSYMPSLMCRMVSDHIEELLPGTCATIAEDIRKAIKDGILQAGSPIAYRCDVEPFERLLPLLDERAKELS